jgi:hypothetical protein
MEIGSAARPTCSALSRTFLSGRLRGFQRFDSFAACGERVTACIAVFAALKARFGSLQERAGFDQLLSRDMLSTCVMGSSDRLSRIAHLLHGRTSASG